MPTTLSFSYSTVSNIYRLAPEVGSLTSMLSADVHGFGGKAQAIVDAKIARLYALPITAEVPILQSLTEDFALYYIFRRLYTSERFNHSPWPDRYKEALDMLEQIADGGIPLVNASGAIVAGTTEVIEVWSNTKGYHPTFTPGLDMLDHVIDTDRIDDERAERDTG